MEVHTTVATGIFLGYLHFQRDVKPEHLTFLLHCMGWLHGLLQPKPFHFSMSGLRVPMMLGCCTEPWGTADKETLVLQDFHILLCESTKAVEVCLTKVKTLPVQMRWRYLDKKK